MPQVEHWELQLCVCFISVATVVHAIASRLLPRLCQAQWHALSDRAKMVINMRLATAPANIYHLWASLRVLTYSGQAILSNQDGVQPLARSTWLLATAMYAYELLVTLPSPRAADLVHHLGWAGLTFAVYWSDMSTDAAIAVLMVRNVAACAFFSLGLSSTLLLVMLLIERLGLGSSSMSSSSPPPPPPPLSSSRRRWRMTRCESVVVARTYPVCVWSLVLTRPLSWAVYIVTYARLWRISRTPADLAIMGLLTGVFAGLVGLHTRWSMAGLRKDAELWSGHARSLSPARSMAEDVAGGPGSADMDAHGGKRAGRGSPSRIGEMVVLANHWLVIASMAAVVAVRAMTLFKPVALLSHYGFGEE